MVDRWSPGGMVSIPQSILVKNDTISAFGKHTKNYGKSPSLMRKSTSSMNHIEIYGNCLAALYWNSYNTRISAWNILVMITIHDLIVLSREFSGMIHNH